MDYNIKLSNGQILKGLIKNPEKSHAVIIMVHGHGEHVQRYNHWAELFYEKNIGFTGVDLPGHGRSDGKRGHIQNSLLFDEMLDILINECKRTFPELPVFLYGHSLGGIIVLDYLIRKNPGIRGAIITSPLLRLGFEPSKAKLILAAVMKHILPGLIQKSDLPAEYLSHDRGIIEKYINDPLVHSNISVNLFHALMSIANHSLSHASELRTPVLLVHGEDDKICSPAGSIEFAEKTGMAELKIWEGGYHELHNEPFKNDVFNYILSWINKRLAS